VSGDSRKDRSGRVSFLSMQQAHTQHLHGARSSTSSTSTANNAVLNGLLPPHRFSQQLTSPNHSPNQSRGLPNVNNQLKRSERIKDIILIIILTFIFAILLLT
jgi:hypothetical protein